MAPHLQHHRFYGWVSILRPAQDKGDNFVRSTDKDLPERRRYVPEALYLSIYIPKTSNLTRNVFLELPTLLSITLQANSSTNLGHRVP
jgi:hypothetical protein